MTESENDDCAFYFHITYGWEQHLNSCQQPHQLLHDDTRDEWRHQDQEWCHLSDATASVSDPENQETGQY